MIGDVEEDEPEHGGDIRANLRSGKLASVAVQITKPPGDGPRPGDHAVVARRGPGKATDRQATLPDPTEARMGWLSPLQD